MDPVAVVVRRRVRAGAEAAYEDWLGRLVAGARDFPGYLGADIQRPVPSRREYVSVFRFADPETLRAFEVSDLRRRALAEVAPLVETDGAWERLTGLEVWFAAPPGTIVAQPSPWRMAVVLIAVVWTLVLTIGWLVGQALAGWPYPVRLLVTVAIKVALMTWVIMPRLTRRLAFWIYPRAASAPT